MCGHVIRSNMQLPYTAHQIADPLFFRKLEEHAIDPLFSWFSSFVLPCVAFCDCLGRQTANLERWSMATAWTTTLLWKLPQSTSATLGPTTVVDPAGGGGLRGLQPPFLGSSRAACVCLNTPISLLLNAASVCAIAYAIHYTALLSDTLSMPPGEGLLWQPAGLCFRAARIIIFHEKCLNMPLIFTA